MSISNWDLLSTDFSVINDYSRDSVFSFIRNRINELAPQNFLDYGAGDGDFAVFCARLPINQIIAYDPTWRMVELASKACQSYPKINVVESTEKLLPESFEIVILNAVWMCLPTDEICMNVLNDIYRLLKPGGRLIASLTHPCFRTSKFSTFRTDFDNRKYLDNGSEFKVFLSDGENEIEITDTHWSLSAMSKQLKDAQFVIEEIKEFPDKTQWNEQFEGSPWMTIESIKLQ